MKHTLSILVLLFTLATPVYAATESSICWNDGSGEVDCSYDPAAIEEQLRISDEDDCSRDSESRCHEFAIQAVEDCTDKGGNAVDECQMW